MQQTQALNAWPKSKTEQFLKITVTDYCYHDGYFTEVSVITGVNSIPLWLKFFLTRLE